MNALDGELRDGRHVMSVRVYYEDTDFSGIVYHATYLRFMERGRTNHLRLVGAGHRVLFEQASAEAPGFAFVVRAMQIEFLKSARMDDVLEVVTAPEEVKGASITLKQRILRADELLVEARVRVAFVCGGFPRRCARPCVPIRSASVADRRYAGPHAMGRFYVRESPSAGGVVPAPQPAARRLVTRH